MSFRMDVRYALRWLRRNPGFAAVAMLTLALGIGANTAIFSFIEGVLLRPLPYADPERLVQVWENVTRPGRFDDSVVVAYPNFVDWRERSRSFEGMAAYSDWSFNVTGGGAPERVESAIVSAEFFRVLGSRPIAGRTFVANEDRPGHNRVVVIGRGLWARRFGGDPNVSGRTIALDGKPFTIVGVVDDAVRLPNLASTVEIFAPVTNGFGLTNRRGHYLAVVARLAPGVTLARARSEMKAIAADIAREHPESNTGHGASVSSSGKQLVGDVRPALVAMLVAVLFVLLIAAANVANMTLARASSREREIAIRVALGAGRGRILRQLLTESLLLAVGGGLLGLVCASFGVGALKILAPPDTPRLADVGVDGPVAAFALLLSAVTGVLFGLAPALHTARAAFAGALKERGTRSGDRRATRVRGALVVAEFALSLMLVAGAGLLLKSFLRLQDVQLGFDGSKTVAFSLDLPDSRYADHAAQVGFQTRLLPRLQAIPGVAAVASVTSLPLDADRISNLSFLIEGGPRDPGNVTTARFNEVSPDYFALLRIPIVRGRAFRAGDAAGAPRVAVINQAMARQFFPGQDPIGRRVTLSDDPKPEDWITVAGIVGDVRDSSPGTAPGAQMYMAYAQHPQSGMTILVRSGRDRRSLAAELRDAVRAVDPEQPVYAIRTIDEVVSSSLGQPRFRAAIIGLFGVMALLLAAVGIYGVMAYSVSQRTQEIGIRMALGASRRSILALIAGRAATLTAAGLGLGALGALLLARSLESLLFEVRPADPASLLVGATLVLAVSTAATLLPARRAASTDPVVALRQE